MLARRFNEAQDCSSRESEEVGRQCVWGGRHGVRGEHILDDKAGRGRCGEIWKVPAPKTLLHNPGGHVYPHTSPNRLSSILAQLFLHPF